MEKKTTKINWKVRFKNKIFLASFISLIVGFTYSMLQLFDVFPTLSENTVLDIIDRFLTVLGLVGVVVDPTTAGLGDSNRALGYAEPWNDAVDGDPEEEATEDPNGDAEN